MFVYLFLLAAVAASPELPTINLTPTETRAIEELVAILAQEESASTIATKTPETTAVAIEAVEDQTTPIIITNSIDASMLEYKHWTGKYSPEKFAISVNGAEITEGKTVEIPAKTSIIEIGYTYSFMNGMRTGGKTIAYKLDESTTHAHITFSWKDDWRVIVDNGVAVKEVTS